MMHVVSPARLHPQNRRINTTGTPPNARLGSDRAAAAIQFSGPLFSSSESSLSLIEKLGRFAGFACSLRDDACPSCGLAHCSDDTACADFLAAQASR